MEVHAPATTAVSLVTFLVTALPPRRPAVVAVLVAVTARATTVVRPATSPVTALLSVQLVAALVAATALATTVVSPGTFRASAPPRALLVEPAVEGTAVEGTAPATTVARLVTSLANAHLSARNAKEEEEAAVLVAPTVHATTAASPAICPVIALRSARSAKVVIPVVAVATELATTAVRLGTSLVTALLNARSVVETEHATTVARLATSPATALKSKVPSGIWLAFFMLASPSGAADVALCVE